MSHSSHVCSGCGATIDRKMDMERLDGVTGPSWRCMACKTTIPSVVAERIKHQRHSPPDS